VKDESGSDGAVTQLTNARIWDGVADSIHPDLHTITIERGVIASIDRGRDGANAPHCSQAGGQRSVDGCVALPGLIDVHVHMDLDPAIGSPAKQDEVSDEDRRLRMIARAAAMARAGITTARDLGAGDYRELDLRDGIARGDVVGPRLLCAGQPLTIPDGHCHFWNGVTANEDERAACVARQLDRDVDWIKVMATGGVFTKGSGVQKSQFSEAELREVVALAGGGGRAVAAHCHGKEGIRNAARAGVTSIEHCSFAGPKGFGEDFDEAVVAEIAKSGAWVSPTVNGGWSRRMEKDGKETDFFQRMKKVLGALRAAGVPLVASTDAGIPGVMHHELAGGLVAFARYAGMQPVEVLRAATSGAAKMLGLGDVTGRLAAGSSGDLVVVDGDPTEDLGVMAQPVLALTRGSVVGARR
jgi:imidazolonepropionase-like amidohydrolase